MLAAFADIDHSNADAASQGTELSSSFEHELHEARKHAFEALETLKRATEVDPQLQRHLTELSNQGEELRQKIVCMIKVFGHDVGRDEKTSDALSTVAGL